MIYTGTRISAGIQLTRRIDLSIRRGSLSFLNRVLDSITDPLVICDRDYRIVAANRALATS